MDDTNIASSPADEDHKRARNSPGAQDEEEHEHQSKKQNSFSFDDDPEMHEIVEHILLNPSSAVTMLNTYGQLMHHLLFMCLMDHESHDSRYIEAFNKCVELHPQGFHHKDCDGSIPLDCFVDGMLAADNEGVRGMVEDLMDLPEIAFNEEGILYLARKALHINPEGIISSGLLEMVGTECLDPDQNEEEEGDDKKRQTRSQVITTLFVDIAECKSRSSLSLDVVAKFAPMRYIDEVIDCLGLFSEKPADGTPKQLSLHKAVSSSCVNLLGNGANNSGSDESEEEKPKHTAPLAIIQKLVGYHPEALSVVDEGGRTPLVCAALNNCSIDVLFYLLRAQPAAVVTNM